MLSYRPPFTTRKGPCFLITSVSLQYLCSLFKNHWFRASVTPENRLGPGKQASEPPASPSRSPPGWDGRAGSGRSTDAGPRPKAKQPETTAQRRANLGLSRGSHRQRSGSRRLPAQRAHTRGPGRSGPPGRRPEMPTSALTAGERPNGRPVLPRPAPPRPGGRGPGRGRGRPDRRGPDGPGRRAPRPRPHPRGAGRRGGEGKGGATHSGRAARSPLPSVPRARARSPQVPRSLTQCRRLRRAQRPGWRNSSGAGGGGVVRQGEGKSARESRRQRETRGGRKRACAPPPASGEAEPQQ